VLDRRARRAAPRRAHPRRIAEDDVPQRPRPAPGHYVSKRSGRNCVMSWTKPRDGKKRAG
jgi:hypothetical protein